MGSRKAPHMSCFPAEDEQPVLPFLSLGYMYFICRKNTGAGPSSRNHRNELVNLNNTFINEASNTVGSGKSPLRAKKDCSANNEK